MLGLNRQVYIEIWMNARRRVRQRGAWSIRKELPMVNRITKWASSLLRPVAADARRAYPPSRRRCR